MLLIVAQLTDSNNTSTGYYWEKIIETLSEKNEILLITEENSPKLLNNTKIQILQVNIPKFLKNNFKFKNGYLSKVIMSFKMLFFSIINSRNKENILVGTNPFLIVLLPIFLNIFFIKTKVSIIVFDLFPENLISTTNSFLVKYFCKLIKIAFDFSYRKFHKVFSIGSDMTKILEQKKIDSKKIFYSPNWCDDIYDFNPNAKKDYLSSLGIDHISSSKIVILYFGNLGYFQNIELFLEIISGTNNKDLIFLFVGNGIKKDSIIEASKLDKRIYYREGESLSNRSKILLGGDISLVTLSDEMLGLAVPSKSYFSLAYGMPLLAIMNKDSEIFSFVKRNDFGWSYSSYEKEMVMNFLENLSFDDIKTKKDKILNKEKKFRSTKTLSVILENLS